MTDGIFGLSLIAYLQIIGAAVTLGLFYLSRQQGGAPRWIFYVSFFLTGVSTIYSSEEKHEHNRRQIEHQTRILKAIKGSLFKLDGMTVSYTLEMQRSTSQYQPYFDRVDSHVQRAALSLERQSEPKAGAMVHSAAYGVKVDGLSISNSDWRNGRYIVQEVEVDPKSRLFPGEIDGEMGVHAVQPLNLQFVKAPLPDGKIPSFGMVYGGYDKPIVDSYDPVRDFRRPWGGLGANDEFELQLENLSPKNRKLFYALNQRVYLVAESLKNWRPDSFRNFKFSTLDDLRGAALYMGSGPACPNWTKTMTCGFYGKIVALSFSIKNGPQITVDCSKIKSTVTRDGTLTYSYVFPSDDEEFDNLMGPARPNY